MSGSRNEADDIIYADQGFFSPFTRLLCASRQNGLQMGLILTQLAEARLDGFQQGDHGIGRFTLEVAVHLAFEVLLQLRDGPVSYTNLTLPTISILKIT